MGTKFSTISKLKSLIRIIGCGAVLFTPTWNRIGVLAFAFLIAEIFALLEKLFFVPDNRQ